MQKETTTMPSTTILLAVVCAIAWIPSGGAAYWLHARTCGNPCATMTREERKNYTDPGELVAILGPIGLAMMSISALLLWGADLCASLGRRWIGSGATN
jgi:hypothetical protein